MQQFNAGWRLKNQLRVMIRDAGIVLPKPSHERSKAIGYMGSRGEYTIGDCVIDTHGHYTSENDDSHYGLRFYKGTDAYWHLGMDEQGRVFFSPAGCFRTPIESVTDWEPTPFHVE